MSDLPTLITRLRTLSNDTTTANTVRDERMKPPPDGNRKVFRLANQNIVDQTTYVTIGSADRTTAGFTVDLVNGYVTFTTAPGADQEPFDVEYVYQLFTDAEYTEFLNEAASIMTNTPAAVPDGLIPALLQFGLSFFYTRRATQYANKYASSAGGTSDQVDMVTTNFRNLAKTAYANGIQLRDDYYQNQGARNAPSSGIARWRPDPFTPRR